MIDVSVLILAKNEEHNIEGCIRSCDFADEIVIIDDFSSDKTADIAQSLGAKVVQHAMNGNWGAQQNFALKQAKHDWILFLDADERITKELASEIETVVAKNEKNAYFIKRENRFQFNKATHGVLRSDFVCRLMPRVDVCVEGFVHPAIITPYPNKKMKNFMLHYSYDNWQQYFNKMNNYTTLASQKYMTQGKKCHFFSDIILRPLWAFIKVYFIQGGFLDGKMGWILSVNHYFYTMNKYVKLYYLNKSNGKL
ncbi:MAG: glycosyltransferase family 2 protein [Campylobacteraceae bacterium]|jgi:glycosyltransferase involved in cell wall biosynthesis|nr:glycosyltransferase family 2 protein [Campylobacteraceae bacterium]